jgi:GntR family transcriptional regulator/MocR family aminotransferase
MNRMNREMKNLYVLFSSYSEVIIEDPSFIEIQNIFVSSGFKISPIPVDEVGIQTNLLPKSNPSGIISVTPSRHFPLGRVLPIKRRIQLIEYAQKNKTYIIENDYDSDFWFTGIPISSLQMLYPERVIHVGTFSEMLYPSVRLGYMVIPGKLIEPCMSFIKVNKYLTSSTIQLALSNFINDGELEKHILRMKKNIKKSVILSLIV